MALYSGMVYTDSEISAHNDEQRRQYLAVPGNSKDDLWKLTKYQGSVGECKFSISLPHDERGSALSSYCATLGHKVNHSFMPNADYGGLLDSPRFGVIRAFVSRRAIKQGEEILINYGYPLPTGPPWYRELYQKYQGQQHADLKADFVLNSRKM